MKKKIKLNPYVQLRMFYKGRVYKVYRENKEKEDLYVEADHATEQEIYDFLENLKQIKFVSSYELIESDKNEEQEKLEERVDNKEVPVEDANNDNKLEEENKSHTQFTEENSDSESVTIKTDTVEQVEESKQTVDQPSDTEKSSNNDKAPTKNRKRKTKTSSD